MSRWILASLVVGLALGGAAGSASAEPGPVRGVTLESVARLDQVEAALARHSRRPTARIVFQHGKGPSDYAPAVRRLGDDADLLGLVLDSTAVRRTSVREYRARTRAFVRRFGSRLDYYEIGNELN